MRTRGCSHAPPTARPVMHSKRYTLCMRDYTISIIGWHLCTRSSLLLYAQGHSNSYLHACIHTMLHCSHNHTHTHTILPRNCIITMMLLWSPNKIIHGSFFFMHLSFAVFLLFPQKAKEWFCQMAPCDHIRLLPHLDFLKVFLDDTVHITGWNMTCTCE